MLAYVNREALRRTIQSGQAWFYSRSRRRLWRKGEDSGNTLRVVEVREDCDGDAFLYLVLPVGPTCHTGRESCFYRRRGNMPAGELAPTGEGEDLPGTILDLLACRINQRLRQAGSCGRGSYVAELAGRGEEAVWRKIQEESLEFILAAGRACWVAGNQEGESEPAADKSEVISEAADLLFHLCLSLQLRGIHPEAVLTELGRRYFSPPSP